MLTLGNRWPLGELKPETLARVAVIVNLALVLLLAHSLADLTWRLLPLPEPVQRATVAPSPSAAPTPADLQKADYAAIAGWHLFGTVDRSQPPPAAVVQEAPVEETRLDLKLVGLFYGEDGARALALIAEGRDEERIYTLGDQLSGGVKLEQIQRDQVILSRNGRRETLSLPKYEALEGAPPTLDRELFTPVSPSLSEPSSASQAEAKVINASAVVRPFREKAISQPEVLQDLAFTSPYLRDGQFTGFRLRPGKNRRLLRRLGLRSGDVVTQINGMPLTSPDQGIGLLQELLNAPQVNLQVLRNGEEIPLTIILDG